ncbi:MAG TPA: hypothetical protein VKA91_04065 [Nitrososphaeraceae archaeon]|nr:hypothetical protein [Nitrososphaeraceae archaeon]
MKRFSQLKLTKGLILLFVVTAINLVYYAFPVYYYDALHVQAQLSQLQQQPPQQQQKPSPIISVKITSPITGQQVPAGELTISGRSTDNPTTDCTVYADWNNTKPFQKAIATGPGGVNDYSSWNYTYTNNYHLITNGTNNLTSKLTCITDPINLTKWNSVNAIGIARKTTNNIGSITSIEEQQQSPNVNSNITTINENNTAPAITAITTTPSPAPSCCPPNQYIANAGPDQKVTEGTMIILNGTDNNNKSSNFENTANYLWRQTNGPAIILNGNNTAHPSFVAPNYPNDTKYTFALEVFENQVNNNNNKQAESAVDTVDIIAKDVNTKVKNHGSLQDEGTSLDTDDGGGGGYDDDDDAGDGSGDAE